MSKRVNTALAIGFALLASSAQSGIGAAPAKIRAFPGAEGAGAFAKGGRGGKVLFVTNLNDSGPGSLRAALEANHPRIVVFRVGGIIELKSDIDIRSPFITVAGQTAPGDGICLKNRGIGVTNTHDVILRYLRVRPGRPKGTQEFDTVGIVNSRTVIIDHCSFSWGNDEVCSMVVSSGTQLDQITVQWCIISECLDWYGHSMGSAIDSKDGAVTLHHNLFAHNGTRNPRVGAWPGHSIRADILNNVFYDWRSWCAYGGGPEEGTINMNFIGNYLKPGPSSKKAYRRSAFLSGSKTTTIHSRSNKFHKDPAVSDKDMINVKLHGGTLVSKRIAGNKIDVKTEAAGVAFEMVLASAGATLPARDPVDARIGKQVVEGTGKIIKSQTEVGGWPQYKRTSSARNLDTDMDGMEDPWELRHGLDPKRADHHKDADKDGYSNIEEFLNGTDPRKSTGEPLKE